MENKEMIYNFNAKLNKGDSEKTTLGCRQNNPNICGYNGIENICAFVSKDGICKKPSRAWKKQYEKLKEEEKKSIK